MLIVVAGLPGTGKTTLAAALAKELSCAHIRIDAIGAALRRAGATPDPVGLADYVIGEAVAESSLRAGATVIIDAVNDSEAPRAQWRALAERCGVNLKVIELTCDDQLERRRRVERREWDLPELHQPTWAEVLARGYAPWHDPRLVLDATSALAVLTQRAVAYCSAEEPSKG